MTIVQANDQDINGNALLVYTFENLSLTSGPFQINKNTGVIFIQAGLAGSIDREMQDTYQVST